MTTNEKINLSNLEKDIIERVCNGYKNKEIAKDMGFSLSILEDMLTHIYKKLSAKNRAHAVYITCKYHLLKFGECQ